MELAKIDIRKMIPFEVHSNRPYISQNKIFVGILKLENNIIYLQFVIFNP